MSHNRLRRIELRTLLFALTLMATPVTAAADKPAVPINPAPSYAVASVGKDGILTYVSTVKRLVPSTRTRIMKKDGKEVSVKYIVYMPVFTRVVVRKKLADLEIYNAAGEKQDAEDVQDELSKPKIVLMSRNGNKVDPFYLKIVKPDTLVIVDKSFKRQPRKRPSKQRKKQLRR